VASIINYGVMRYPVPGLWMCSIAACRATDTATLDIRPVTSEIVPLTADLTPLTPLTRPLNLPIHLEEGVTAKAPLVFVAVSSSVALALFSGPVSARDRPFPLDGQRALLFSTKVHCDLVTRRDQE
jgi:hypothetical protein